MQIYLCLLSQKFGGGGNAGWGGEGQLPACPNCSYGPGPNSTSPSQNLDTILLLSSPKVQIGQFYSSISEPLMASRLEAVFARERLSLFLVATTPKTFLCIIAFFPMTQSNVMRVHSEIGMTSFLVQYTRTVAFSVNLIFLLYFKG